MEGELVSIRQILNEDLTINCYEILVDVMTLPPLKLGKCKILQ